MAEKILIDTDVCLDALTDREPFSKSAQYLLYLSETSKIETFVTSVSFSNMFNLISKWMSVSKAYQALSKLRKIVSVAAITTDHIDSALENQWQDFEYSLQSFAATTNDCSCIITRNVRDYKNSDIPVMTPTEFIEQMG